MGNYELLKAAINEVIKANGRQEITGEVLNQVLLSMVNSLGAGYQCMGVATPSTNPGTPDQNVFYFATQAGTYTNFDAIVLQAGISVLIWDGDWASQTWYTVDSTPTNNSQNLIASGAVFNALKLDGGAYDVTAHNSGATFASLSALLNSENLNTLIPTEIRHGGMSIKFVQSSDNKYVQYKFLLSGTFTDAQFATIGSWALVKSTTYGIIELYLLPNSGIGSIHLVYRNNNGKWYVVFFNSTDNGSRVASTIEYTSESAANGILPIYKYTTSLTNEVVGYIIVDWTKFNTGANALVASVSDYAYNLHNSPSIENYLLSSKISTLKEDDIISDTISKKGVKELYLLPNSDIGSVHLVYRNNSGLWYVKFFDSPSAPNSQVGQTLMYASESAATGVLPIYEYTTDITSTIIGYIIIDWEKFSEGSNVYLGIPTDKAENILFSPIINNYLQDAKNTLSAEDSYLEDGIDNAPIVVRRENFELGPSNLVGVLNNAFMAFGRLCRCHWYDKSMYLTKSTCMDLLKVEGYTEANMIKTVNHNLRNNVFTEGMSYDMMARRINYFLTVPAIQFCDAQLNNTDDVNFSLPINLPIGEPSTVVSEDGGTMYVYCGCLYRYKTTDGVNYTLDSNIKLANVDMTQDNPEYLMHCNVNLINGVYYLIGTHTNFSPLVLWTSTDGVNFTKIGTIMRIGDTINQAGDTIENFGNTFLYKDPFGKWYLYYELSRGNVGWETALATCDDILNPIWEQIPTNPIFASSYNADLGIYEGHGNPAFAVGENNLPIKQDGKYYIYLHSENGVTGLGTTIRRYYSTDLINWVSEGKIIDYRDIPHTISNGDMCFQQFKGRTYQFYTYDINPTPEQMEQGYDSQLRVLIDDRPFIELLKLRP